MKVFISHAAQDRDLAGELARILRKADVDVWTESEILPGDNFARKVGEALDECSAMVVLVSPEWADSQWGREEASYAMGGPRYAGRLIPIIVRPTEDIPWVFSRMQIVDGTQDVETVSRHILDRIQQPVG